MNPGASYAPSAPIEPRHVTLLTVTYGSRWALLQQCIAAGFEQGAGHVIVLDNGSAQDITALAAQAFGPRVTVHRLPRNAGSATGFAEVMRQALTLTQSHAQTALPPWLLLMDDDNALAPGGLARLCQAYQQLLPRHGTSQLAVTAYRDRHVDQAKGIPSLGMYGGSGSAFIGFHVGDLPVKLLRRTPLGRAIERRLPIPPLRQIFSAAYSGMLFHRDVLTRHGLPDARFLLYSDDIEFSSRLSRAGGAIYLVTDARIQEIEASWQHEKEHANAFASYLDGGSDFRIYYYFRNTAFYERHALGGLRWLRAINRLAFMAILRRMAARLGQQQRLALIERAIADGEQARMGEHADFKLP